MDEPTPTPDANKHRSSPPSTHARAIVIVIALALGILGGFLAGGVLAARAADRDDAAADRASEQEDELRDRRDMLDARVELIEQQIKPLKEVATKGALRATAKSTHAVKGGDEFSVDGGTYTVRSVSVVDSFESKDPRRTAEEVDGHRWLLVDTDFTNRTKENAAPACGIMGTVRAVLTDGTTVLEDDFEPPVHPDTYDVCGYNLDPGKSGRWIVPILVPDDASVEGLLIEDVYARTSKSQFKVVAGKGAWLRFDEPIDIDAVSGDEPVVTYVDEEDEQ